MRSISRSAHPHLIAARYDDGCNSNEPEGKIRMKINRKVLIIGIAVLATGGRRDRDRPGGRR
jgi:hypothetical protein